MSVRSVRRAEYPGAAVARAREHGAAGWTITEIQGLIEREFGRRPSWRTVKAWLDPRYREYLLAEQRPRNRARRLEARGRRPVSNVSDEWKLARMRELHETGLLSFAGIGAVAGIWWGEPLSEDTVAARLDGRPARRTYRKAAA